MLLIARRLQLLWGVAGKFFANGFDDIGRRRPASPVPWHGGEPDVEAGEWMGETRVHAERVRAQNQAAKEVA